MRHEPATGENMKWHRDPLGHGGARLALIASVSASAAYGMTRIYFSLVGLPEGTTSVLPGGVFFGAFFSIAWLLTRCTGGAP
jgi:hypothetical protein